MATVTELPLSCPVPLLLNLLFMIVLCNTIIPILQMMKPEAEEVKQWVQSLMVSNG